MGSIELYSEFSQALENHHGLYRALSSVKKLGVTPESIVGGGFIAALRIRPEGDLYVPDPQGHWSIIQPVLRTLAGVDRSLPSNVTDLVAWRPTDPAKWWLRDGAGDYLGSVSPPTTLTHVYPLPFHRTPLAWLKSGCVGICILDDANARISLPGFIIDVLAEDYDHGVELREVLNPAPPKTNIVIPELRVAA